MRIKSSLLPRFIKHFDELPPLTETRVSELITAAVKGLPTAASLKATEDKLTAALAALGEKIVPPPAPPVPPPAPVPPAPGTPPVNIDPVLKAQLDSLERANKETRDQLKAEKDLREAAEKKARDTQKNSEVRASLTGFRFVNADAAQDAFNIVVTQTEFADDGSLIAGGLPLADFVKNFIPEKKNYLLLPEDKGGTGAPNSGTGRHSLKPFDTDQIKHDMTKDDVKAASKAILDALGPDFRKQGERAYGR